VLVFETAGLKKNVLTFQDEDVIISALIYPENKVVSREKPRSIYGRTFTLGRYKA
jgi:hypothetical protein